MTRTRSLLIAAFCLCHLDAAGQPQGPGMSSQPGSPIMLESFPRGPADSLRGTVDVHFRIDAGFFVPVRMSEPSAPDAYARRGEVLIELADSTGMTRARDIARLERDAPDTERPRPGTEWIQGGFTFTVPFGTYTMLVEVTDAESKRSVTDRSRKVHVHAVAPAAAGLGIFVSSAPGPGLQDTIRMQNFGGDVFFGSAASLYTELPLDAIGDSTADAAVRIEMLLPGSDDPVAVRADTARDIRVMVGPRAMRIADTLGLAYVADSGHATAGLRVPLNTQSLPLRRYRVTALLTTGAGEFSITRDFRMIWPDMPRSLRNVDEAISALKYVASDAAVDSLLEGPLEARWANLEGFWKPRDRSPETAPNEVMTEYYRRVDHAREAFGTLRQPDGFLTDRGRIYVLHGPPTTSERSLDPAEGFREVWTYASRNKTFVFVDRSKTGEYILVQRPAQ